jgi:hypothetical protein
MEELMSFDTLPDAKDVKLKQRMPNISSDAEHEN